MKSTQSHLSYLIFGFLFLMSLQGWASFVQGTHVLTQIQCNGDDGQIRLVLASQSGESGINYEWFRNTGSGWLPYPAVAGTAGLIHTIVAVPEGSYYAKITGNTSNDQQFTEYFDMVEPSVVTLDILSSATYSPLCSGTTPFHGGSTAGQISVTAAGGTGSIEYSFSTTSGSYSWGASAVFNPTGVATGGTPYYMRARDARDCRSAEKSIPLAAPAPLSLNIPGATNISCNGETDGVLTISGGGSGGTGTLSYGYADAASTPAIGAFSFTESGATGVGITFNNLGASTNSYFVAAQDENGCSVIQAAGVDLNEPPIIGAITSFTRDNPSGLSANNGSITASGAPGGGTGGLTYRWVNNQNATTITSLTTPNISGLVEATYTLTATDTKGCTRTYAQQNIEDCFDIAASLTNLTKFNFGDGAIALTALENNAPDYTAWSADWWEGTDNTGVSRNPQASDGTFDATGTALINQGGTFTLAVGQTLNLDNQLELIESGDVVTGTGIVGVVTVNSVNTTGTTTSNQITLNQAQTLSDNAALTFHNSDKGSIAGLAAGTYYVEVTASGVGTCTKGFPYTLTEPDEFLITSIDQPRKSFSTAKVNGAITTASTAIVLDNNGGTIVVGSVVSGTGIIGAPTVTVVTNQNNITLSSAQILSDNVTLSFAENKGVVDLICDGDTDADIVLTVSGGTAPYTTEYLLPNTSTAEVVSGVTSSVNLAVDNHSGAIKAGDIVTGTGISLNTTVVNADDQYNLVLSVAPGVLQVADAVLTFTSAGSATIDQTGNGFTLAAGANLTLNAQLGLIAVGDVVTGGGILGNVTVASATTTATTTNTITLSSTQTLSDNDDLTFSKYSSVSGLKITDVIHSSNTGTDKSGSEAAYAYAVRVKDKNGIYTEISSVDIIVPDIRWDIPSTGASTLTVGNILCSGTDDGTAYFTALSGSPIPSDSIRWYKWISGSATELTAKRGSISVGSLGEGTYSLEMTDTYGCAKSSNFAIYAPEALSLDETITAVACSNGGDGSIDVIVGGGTAAYTYVWSQGGSPLTPGSTFSKGATINDISTASVSAIVSASATVPLTATSGTIAAGDVVSGAGIVNQVSTASLNAAGGVSSVTTLPLDGNAGTIAVGDIVTGVGIVGKVTVTNAGTQTAIVLNNSVTVADDVVLTFTSPIVVNTAGGSITLKSRGSTKTVTLAKDVVLTFTSETTTTAVRSTITSLVASASGQYTLEITDANSCVLSAIYDIGVPQPFVFTATETEPTCLGDTNGAIDLSLAGGTVTTATVNGATTGDADLEIDGQYGGITEGSFVTGTGISGTVTVQTVTDQNTLVLSSVQTLSDDVVLTFTKPAGGYQYSWTKDGGSTAYATGQDLTSLGNGAYTIAILDGNGCAASATYYIASPSTSWSIEAEVTDATCKGDTNGKVDVSLNLDPTASLGNHAGNPYTYSWTQDGTSYPEVDGQKLIIDLGTGTYAIDATDKFGCVHSASYIVADFPAMVISSKEQALLCPGVNDATIEIEANGGNGTYSYVWTLDGDIIHTPASSGLPTLSDPTDLSSLGAGVYEVTVSDEPVTTTSSTLSDTPASLVGATLTLSTATALEVGDVVTGFSSSATAVTVAAITSSTVVILSSSTQSLPGTALNFTRSLNLKASCSAVKPFTISEITPFAISDQTITNPTCQDGSDGAIFVDVTGGTEGSGYTYQWKKDLTSTPQTYVGNTATISNLSGDNPSGEIYRLVVTDSRNCVSGNFDFTVASPTTSYSINDGRIYVPVTASVNGVVNSTALVLDNHRGIIELGDSVSGTGITGTVTVSSITNQNNVVLSSSQTLSNDVVLTFTSLLSTARVIANTSLSNLLAVDTNIGTIEVGDIVTGGTISGTVIVRTVTDKNNLILSSAQSLVANQNLTFTKNLQATTVSDVTCNGDLNGYLNGQLSIDAGHPASYQYTWYAGQDTAGTQLEVGQKNLTARGIGYYTFKVEDFYGCIQTNTYEISQYSSMSVSTAQIDNVCGEDQIATISIEANGGDSYNYTYQWSRNGIDFEPTDSLWSDENIFDLVSGDYKVIVTDNLGCAINESFTINSVAPIAVSETVIQNICNEGAIGAIDVMVSGGNAPYVATWAEVGSYVSSIANLAENDTYSIGALDSGVYTLSIVDRLDCPTFSKDIIITEPLTSYAINPLGTGPSCFEAQDGIININVTEEVGHPTSYQLIWKKDGELLNASEDESITALNGGFYEFSIIDDNGCQRSDTLTLIEPADIYLHPIIDTLECYNASNAIITLDPTGGTDLYPFIAWKYNGLTTSTVAFEASYLAAGDHSIRVIDSNGCLKDSTIVIDNPANMAVDPTITNVLCKDASTGAISVAMINGQPGYSYAWVAEEKVFSTSTTIDSLATGDYFLAVQDSYLCLSDTFTINVPEPNNRYNINGDITRVSCRDSSDAKILVSIEVLGESTEFTYEWEKEDVLISESRDQVDIDPGTYTIDVKDNFGCVRTNTFTVENPDAVNVTSTQENILCFGDSTGLIALSPTGGWGKFSYEWERNLVSLPISESFGNTLPVGDYIIDVIDDGLCVTPVYVTLTAPDTIAFNAFSTNLTCYENKDGAISVSVVGGVPEYTYNWAKDGDPYSQDINLSRLGGGNYELIITDAALCEYSSGIIEITEPEVLSLEVLSFQNNLCTTTSNGAFEVQAKGGTGAYRYRLNDGDLFPTSDYDGLKGGNQIIEILDDNLCSVDTTLVVETDYLLISAFTWDYDYPYIDWPVSFFDGSLGPDIVNWSWDLGNGALTNEVNSGFTYVSPGSYPITLKVTNIVGCEAVMTEMLDIEKGFRVTMPSAFTPNLDGLNDYFRPTLENIISMHLIVYNKYGSVVYETRDLDGEWDGSLDLVPLPQDSYLYEITYVAESGVARTSRGKVAMLR